MHCEESLCLGGYLSKQPRCNTAPAYSSLRSFSNSWLVYAGITNIRFSDGHISGVKSPIWPLSDSAVNERSIPEKASFAASGQSNPIDH